MAVHNSANYLRQALESILNQSYSDFEFIVIDDGSSDNTSSILAEYALQDRRIVLVRNQTNLGLARSLNTGLGLAQSEFIARMDADDISLPERLATQVSVLDKCPEVGVLGTAACLIDSCGSLGQRVQYPERHDQLHWIMCFFENPIIHPSVMFRKKLVKDLGGYDETYTTSQDYNLWSRVLEKARLANVQDVYLYLRKHEDNISHLRRKQQQEFSLEISASLVSRMLNTTLKPAQLQHYCDFLWNQTKLPVNKLSFVMTTIFRLAKNFIGNQQMISSDRLWIVDNAVNKLSNFKHELDLSFIEQMKLNYLLWSLRRLV